MPLDLVIPDLLLPPDAPASLREARLAHAERWLARADFEDFEAGGPRAWIAARYGLAAPVPVAPIALAGEGEEAGGDWICADPVHLRIERDATVLHDASALGLDRAEADALVASLQAHFAQDGLEMRAPSPGRWYARVPAGELPRTFALDAAVGRNVFGMLPEGGARIRWRAALTEAQMVMAAHEVNARREPARPAVNSVWFWGEGTLPASLPGAYHRVLADDVFARGLGRLSGAEARALPESMDAVLASPGQATLVVLDGLTPALRSGDTSRWLSAAAAIDRAWFEAIPRALAAHDAVRIVLPGDRRTRVATLGRRARWRLLRARKPLSAHA